MIEVRDLVYEYPTKRALDGVSFTIRPGTITALVGPNGAGKTTLLRCVAALEPPYSGTVTIDGIDTTADPRAIHERLGYLPDFYGLYDELTVWRALYFAARSHALPPDRARKAAEAAAAAVNLTDRLEQRAGELSRGLRQRLAIGQAIVHEPKVLLLDEPASGLDPDARRSLSGLFIALRDKGLTLVVSSHILAELEDYASAMLIIKDGKLAGGDQVSLGQGSGKVTIRIETAAPDPRLFTLLKTRRGIDLGSKGENYALIRMEEDRGAMAALLRDLVEAGLAVCVFAPAKERLEDRYFEETHKAG